MKIFVKVKARAKNETIKKIDENHFFISVKNPPEKGRANKAVVSMVADYFHIPKSHVAFVSGFTSKNKLLEIGTERKENSKYGIMKI